MSLTTLIPRAFKLFTRDEQRRSETKAMIREIMMAITHNTVTHAEVIAKGPVEWRNTFLREMRGMAVDSKIADLVYVGICKAWRQAYGEATVTEVLDTIEVKSPLTEQEIEDAWEHDASSSSWDARRKFYMDYPSRFPIEIHSAPTSSAPAPSVTDASPSKGVH